MKKEIIKTEKAPTAIGPYSQAVRTGRLLFVSGQLGINPESNRLAGNEIEKQSKQSLENLKSILGAAGSSLDKVLKVTVFLKDMNNFSSFNNIYETYFVKEFPSRSCIEVSRLPMDAMVEVEAIAMCEENASNE